jgi:hypothetical protein
MRKKRDEKSESGRYKERCIGCGRLTANDSKHWKGGKICEECEPFDEEIAADKAWHAMTGE